MARTYDALVIGGGPSGIAATSYGVQLGLDTLMVTPDLGGTATTRDVGDAIVARLG